eukprot:14565025-Ditylum_brightwellii.AAC.1
MKMKHWLSLAPILVILCVFLKYQHLGQVIEPSSTPPPATISKQDNLTDRLDSEFISVPPPDDRKRMI